MDTDSAPDFLDFYSITNKDFNIIAFQEATENWNESERKRRISGNEGKPPGKKAYAPRIQKIKRDPKLSFWWSDYIVDEGGVFDNPEDRNGKLFRQRFAYDKSQFREVLDHIRAANIWSERASAAGKPAVPLELLLLGSLRILTRNWTFDDLLEATFISERTHRKFLIAFVDWMANNVYPLYVKLPTAEELDRNGAEYTAAGVPGTVASVDVVHIRQWAVCANLKQFATGKEKFPTRAYEVMVNHRRLILYVTPGFYGSVVDKTIVKFDEAMTSIRDGLYSEYETKIYNDTGLKIDIRGAHTINDNGYLNWACMMEPSKISSSVAEANWSEMVESLRKDVECTFGILKALFAILKYGSRFTDMRVMDNIFKTCCTIYNQKLLARGGDEPWVHLSTFEAGERNLSVVEEDTNSNYPDIFNRLEVERSNVRALDFEMSGIGPGDDILHVRDTPSSKQQLSHNERKQALITHFAVALGKGEVIWPRQHRRHHLYVPTNEI